MSRGMVMRLAELAAVGARDPRETVAPFVDTLLELREHAREQSSWTLADTVRDRLTAAGIEVRDTPQGVVLHSQTTPKTATQPVRAVLQSCLARG